MHRIIASLAVAAGVLVLPVSAGVLSRPFTGDALVFPVTGSVFGPRIAAASAAMPRGAASLDAAPRLTRATLPNGLRVAIVENHSAPAVRVAVRYRYGTDDEPRGKNGLAHALEHMMFRGTRTLSGSGLVDLQAQLGIDASAETGREETLYYQTVLSDRLAPALRIEADRMRGLALRTASWESERPALLEEIREAASRRRGVLEDAVRDRVYGPTSYAHGGVGTAAAMHAITPADLRRAYDTAYAPDNALLVIAGDVEPRAALALVRTVFGEVRGRAHLARAAQPAPRRGLRVSTDGGDRTLVDVALEAHGSAGPDGAAEAIAAELLAPEHPSLDEPLVENGPCNSYYLDDDTERHGGIYHVLCWVGRDQRPEHAVGVVRATLRKLAAHPPHDAIARARRSYIDATVFQCDDLADESDLFGVTLSLLDADPRSLDRVAARVSDAQVAAVLGRWATPLAIGIAQATAPGRTAAGSEKRTKAEPAPRSHGDEPVVEPAWAHAELDRALRLPPTPPVNAFALPNGVRVFVDRHRGNGTVYVRAGIDDDAAFGAHFERFLADYTLASGTAAWPRARVAQATEARGMTVELGTETAAHGFARDFPVMLGIVADAWRAPRTYHSAKARAFLAATVRPERFWIAVTGDVDPAAVRAIVTRDLAGWHAGPPAPAPAATAAPTIAPGIHALPGRRPTVRVFMLLPAPRADDPDSATIALINEVLGADDDFDTRLVRDLRTRRGLVYGAASFYGDFLGGRLAIAFECAPSDLAAARAAVYGVLDGLRTNPPTGPQLERARRKLVIAALLARTTSAGRLDALAAARAHGVPDDPEQLLHRLSAVTAADAARVARSYFRRDRFVEFDDRSTR